MARLAEAGGYDQPELGLTVHMNTSIRSGSEFSRI